MATYVLPNIQTGGSITVQGNSLADAQRNAASATGVSLAAQQGGGTFGGEGGQGTVESGGSSRVSGGSSGSPSPSPPTPSQPTGQDLDAYIQRLLNAQSAGDQKALQETIREFDLKYGLDRDQFNENTRQYNQNYLISQAGLTGMYQGAPTMQLRSQLAQLYGTETPTPGQQTLAAQQQAYSEAFNVAQLAAQLQANPFRQQEVLGQAGRLLGGLGVAGFQAPNQVAGVGTAGGNQQGGLGYLQQIINDIRDPTPNQTTADQFLANTPTPNKLDSASFLRAAPSTQNIVLQAMQQKYGISPDDAVKQIQSTLPQFTAPAAFGAVRR